MKVIQDGGDGGRLADGPGSGDGPSAASADRLDLGQVRRVLEGLIGVPATEGNLVDVLRNGGEIFPAMLEAIREATATIDFLTFVYWTGDPAEWFAEALAERARHGVRVRVLLDALGTRTMRRDLIRMMERDGCQVEFFRPPGIKVWEQNHRTHRKVLICDEEVAFTGGVGIAEEWMGDARDDTEWRDTHLRVRGPAVDGLRAAFASNWVETGRDLFDEHDRFPEQPMPGKAVVQVVRSAADVGWTDMATVFRTIVLLAKQRLRFTTAYFVPDETFLGLLCEAAGRGVQVEVMMPGRHADKRFVQLGGEAAYERLLDAGVRLLNYQQSMLHAKIATADGQVSVVGSANLNQRSMCLDEEVVLVVLDAELAARLDADFDRDLEHCEDIDPERWRRRGLLQRAKERAADTVDHFM